MSCDCRQTQSLLIPELEALIADDELSGSEPSPDSLESEGGQQEKLTLGLRQLRDSQPGFAVQPRLIQREFSLSTYPDAVLSALRGGFTTTALKLAATFGFGDENTLTNLVFFFRYPERGGRSLARGEPNFDRLVREWVEIRDTIVRPFLQSLPRHIEDRTNRSPKSKRKKTRSASSVYALVLHQMAFSRGSNLAKYDNVTSHYVITPDGKISQLHPVSAYLWSSNGFNAGSVAVEFAGNFPNTKGKCWSAARFGCHEVTKAQVETGRFLLKHLQQTIGLTHVLAHRQSSRSRANDPGPDIWFNVGQWGIRNLALKDGGNGFSVGSRQPIPDSWRNWNRSPTR